MYDVRTEAPEVASLASETGRKMGYVNRKVLTVNASVHHQDISGPELLLLLRAEGNRNLCVLEGEWDGPAVNVFELVRPVEKAHVHASAVRSVVVYDFIMCGLELRLGNEVLQHEAILNLGYAENRVECPVGLGHLRYDSGHIVELLPVFDFSPLILSVRKELVVILPVLVVGVEEILEIVESDNVVLLGLERIATGQCGRQCEKQRSCGNQRNDCDM